MVSISIFWILKVDLFLFLYFFRYFCGIWRDTRGKARAQPMPTVDWTFHYFSLAGM